MLQALARKPHQEVVMVVLLLSNMGLFLVDHIHFQVSSVPPNTALWGKTRGYSDKHCEIFV